MADPALDRQQALKVFAVSTCVGIYGFVLGHGQPQQFGLVYEQWHRFMEAIDRLTFVPVPVSLGCTAFGMTSVAGVVLYRWWNGKGYRIDHQALYATQAGEPRGRRVRVEVRREFPYALERVQALFTDPAQRGALIHGAPKVEILGEEPAYEPGRRIRSTFGLGSFHLTEILRVERTDAGLELVELWPGDGLWHQVALRLEPTDDGCRAALSSTSWRQSPYGAWSLRWRSEDDTSDLEPYLQRIAEVLAAEDAESASAAEAGLEGAEVGLLAAGVVDGEHDAVEAAGEARVVEPGAGR